MADDTKDNQPPKRREKFLEDAYAIREASAEEREALGFTARVLVQAAFPHQRPPGNTWTRRNGTLCVRMTALSPAGLPYGSYPRLLITWLTTEALRNKRRLPGAAARHIVLGQSLSGFMASLGLLASGGRKGTIGLLRDQMARLFGTAILTLDDGEDPDTGLRRLAGDPWVVVDKYRLWWDPRRPDQGALWKSYIRLSESFFELITERPVPVDLDAIKLLKKSPLALDAYCWATCRVSYLNRPTVIPWRGLMLQLGSGYPDTAQGRRDFKKKLVAALRKVHHAWPGLRAEPQEAGLRLRPCRAHVPPKPPVDNPVD